MDSSRVPLNSIRPQFYSIKPSKIPKGFKGTSKAVAPLKTFVYLILKMGEDTLLTASELQAITSTTLPLPPLPSEECVESWLHWFQKRGAKTLKTSAQFGYYEATFVLPCELSDSYNQGAFQALAKGVKKLVPGCSVFIVEEDYENTTRYLLEVSWKPALNPGGQL